MQSPLYRKSESQIQRLRTAETVDEQRGAGLETWQLQRSLLPRMEPGGSRENLLEHERLHDINAREWAAIEAMRLKEQDITPRVPRVVIAHRHDWVAATCRAGLLARGWSVTDVQGDATEAIAALVMLQPDVLLCSDRMLGGEGLEVLRRAPRLAPDTRLVVQVDQADRSVAVRDAGAHLILPRSMTAPEVVQAVDELIEIVVELSDAGGVSGRR